ncbi:MBL fold metallo-hydrolase [Paenibacillus macquariensis]|uniref:Beta-Casp domain-containing protein n=1 Tax=Paenibacillus macquariensis TaxID=948756 RepID=A0ABY1KAV1_9BACL|nr:MBL fold metallo-hydrolase [Paenibacillus macquariensis]MEC0089484.1 MBL fold metallo-hydrolase [Paenibacillus macquariensis]OAB25840.1 MBL fold metallo-hydrolase [Paenibacillus macquariensis subsp. macquariensis]SIR52658.1 Beta-Casp domain-containing protein [Paenibacillus macquariensis]
MIKLKIWGGAGEHGRSCYFFSGEQNRIMLDCGVKKEGVGIYPLLDAEEVSQLTAVFLSHAHEDHSIGLPLLYKHGYKGDIWTTRATSEQLGSYFDSWCRYVNRRGGELPYEERHIDAMTYRYLEDYALPDEWFELSKDLRIKWGRSGHLAGSVWLLLEMEGRKVFFSGDYSRESQLLDADLPTSSIVDLSIIDNAYGMESDPQQVKLEQLTQAAKRVLGAGGHLLLPIPTLGRGQELLIWASELFVEYRIIVEQEIWLGLERMRNWSEWLRAGALQRIEELLNSNKVVIPIDDQERSCLLESDVPSIIFTGDGMMESPRARWYYDQLSQSEKHAVILTGHTARGSFGREVLNKGTLPTGCSVQHICYKVHQGLPDVSMMLNEVPSSQAVLVHAPKEETDLVVARLRDEGHKGLHSLQPGIELDFR